jgi:hypothetical protein
MQAFLRALGLLIATTCLVWVAVLWHWQATRRDMSSQDILVYLGALPLTLFALLCATRWAWQGARARLAPPPPGTPALSEPAPPAATAAPLVLLDAQVLTPVGESAAAVLSALAVGQPRPRLDPAWRDDRGLPVLTARVASINEPAEEDCALEQVWGAPPPEDVRRTWTLARRVLQAALQNEPDADPPGGSGFQLCCAWPAPWDAETVGRVEQALRVWLEQAAPRRSWRIEPLGGGPEHVGWAAVEARLRGHPSPGAARSLWLLAAHSAVAPEALRRLEDGGQLFSSHRPHGQVPGEAAVLLHLAGPTDTDEPTPPAWARLHPAATSNHVADATLAASAARARTVDLVGQALSRAALPSPLGGVVSDASLQGAQTADACAALQTHGPDLDPLTHHRGLGVLCGHLGPCRFPLALALAAEAARQTRQPWLALSLSDPASHQALAVSPEAAPAAAHPCADRPNARTTE